MGRLDGKTAIVTGAASGIGEAAASLFAREGARVAVVDIRSDEAERVAEAITADGGDAVAVEADVTSPDDVARMVSSTIEAFGALHVLYNNAGVFSSGDVVSEDEQGWDHCLDVNAKGSFLCAKHVAPAIVDAGGGAIVNQASVAALVGVTGLAAYSAAKGAVVALTRSMAVDLSPQGVRVNCVCPGTVITPLTERMLRARGDGDVDAGIAATVTKYPLGRLGTPEDIASVACFLASDEAAFVTGAIYTVDGGMTAQ